VARKILFVCDDNYVYPLIIALSSVRQSSKSNFEVLIINVTNWTPENPLIKSSNLDLIREVCRSLDFGFSIIDIHLNDEDLLESRPSYGHITGSAWAKILALFLIDETRFPEILYLDPDTLALPGFEEIFDIVLDSKIGLAARATTGHDSFEKTWSEKYESETHGSINKKTGWYFNSGVLIVNIHKFQNFEHWIDWKLLMKNNDKYGLILQDQDLLNALTLGQVNEMGNSYNCYPSEFSISDTRIIHFAGGYKPWQFRNSLSRLRISKNARNAMQLWWQAEENALIHLSKNLNDYELNILLGHRERINKGLTFALAKLFPRFANKKQIRFLITRLRRFA
jgi:lipopolysaccharide biosynthesis glycosyltransferase